MAKLTTAGRNKLPKSDFADPTDRGYPISDPAHGRAALSRVAANGTPQEKAMVRAHVAAKFPGMKILGMSKKK